MNASRVGRINEYNDLLQTLIAIVSVSRMSGKQGDVVFSDMFVSPGAGPVQALKFDDIDQYLQSNRVLTWQDELAGLIDSGKWTAAAVKKALPRNHDVGAFLAERGTGKLREP